MSMLFPVAAVSVVGLASGLILSIASKVMAVKVDEKFLSIRAMLPGANCAACGYASCDSYAQDLVDHPDIKNNLCVLGGNKVSADISAVLGEAYEEVDPVVAVVKCQGNCGNTQPKMEYKGAKTCAQSKLIFGGVGSCSYGCIGYGDCAKVCNYDAICIKDGLAYIDFSKCVGCGMCAKICPSGIIEIIDAQSQVYVACSSKDKGGVARKNCTAACIGCKKCERACPAKAIVVTDNVAHIDQDLCTSCGLCAAECPTKAIVIK